MHLFDTHAHVDDRKFDADRPEVLARAQAAGVVNLVNVGYDLPSSRRSVGLAEKYPHIYAAVGIHPHDAAGASEEVYSQLKELAANPKVVAVGEIGLDYYRDLSPRDVQMRAFRRQLQLAREVELPVIIHDRDAHGDIMQVLREGLVPPRGGVMHCFAGSLEMARECVNLGFYISFAGPVTFQNARKLTEIAAAVPLERLLIETDCPYLTPDPHRGKRNEPAYVVHVAEKIAALRGISAAELAQAAATNACTIFGIGRNLI